MSTLQGLIHKFRMADDPLFQGTNNDLKISQMGGTYLKEYLLGDSMIKTDQPVSSCSALQNQRKPLFFKGNEIPCSAKDIQIILVCLHFVQSIKPFTPNDISGQKRVGFRKIDEVNSVYAEKIFQYNG